MAVLQLPQTAQEVLPFAILFGTMLAFWRLTRNNELVVARAAGISVWQFLAPAVLTALLVGIFAVTVFNPIASLSEAAYEKLDARILRQSSDAPSLSSAGLWLRQSDAAGNQVIIHADKLASPNLRLDDVTLFYFDGLGRFTSRVDAHTARLADGAWLIEDGIRWSARPAAAAVCDTAAADPADAAQDRGKLCLARHDVVLGAARVHRALGAVGISRAAPSPAFRRSARAAVFVLRDGAGGGDLQLAHAAARRGDG